MITLPGLTEENILLSDHLEIQWLFVVTDKNDVRYYWSLGEVGATEDQGDLVQMGEGSFGGDLTGATGGDNLDATTAYEFKVINFNGLRLKMTDVSSGIIAPSNIVLTVINKDGEFTPTDFDGGTLWVHISLRADGKSYVIRRNRFFIYKGDPGNQSMFLRCRDYLTNLMRGDYPNTPLVDDLFPTVQVPKNDGVCIPEIYGTAFIPLRPIIVNDANTITDTDISFVASASGADCEINQAGAGLGVFEDNQFIVITGAANAANNGTFLTKPGITAAQILLPASAGLANEGTGATVTISQKGLFFILGETSNTYLIDKVRTPRSVSGGGKWSNLSWLLSDNGTNEYYAVSQNGANPFLNIPRDALGVPRLLLNNISATRGTVGSLNSGEWDFGDNEGTSLDYDTVYVRLSDSTDPDGKSANYVSIDFAMIQSTQSDGTDNWRVFQPIISDSDADGIADSPGFFSDGEGLADLPVKFSSSNTASIVDPGDVISNMLTNIGLATNEKDLTALAAASATFAGYTVPLVYSGGFWMKVQRDEAFNLALRQCNSVLIPDEKLQLHVLTNTSQKELHRGIDLTDGTYMWVESASGTDEYWLGLLSETELMTDANATSDPNGNEADSITGWSSNFLTGTGANIFESQGAVKDVGSYAFHSDANDTPNNHADFYKDIGTDLSLDVGTWYQISFTWRHIGSGGPWLARFSSSTLLNVDVTGIGAVGNTDITFMEITFAFQYTTNHRYFGFRETGMGNNGGVYVDNLSILEIEDPGIALPSKVNITERSATKGTVGALNTTEWAYSNNGSFDTLYARLADGTDPDTKAPHYIYLPSDELKVNPESAEPGPGSFRYNSIVADDADDAGNVGWQKDDEPIDQLLTMQVPIGATATKLSRQIIDMPWIRDSRDAKRAGIIYFQRKLGRIADITNHLKPTWLTVQPGDVITLNDDNYGGNYDVMVSEINIQLNGTIKMTFVRFK